MIMMMGHGMEFGMCWVGMIVQLVLIIAIVYFLVSFFRREDILEKKGSVPTNDAQDIVRERFAKGEITEEEYERMLKVLSKK